MGGKCLEDFEKLNATTESIHDLGDYNVLIILKDGTNLTSWDDVKDKKDIIYVSEDLSGFTNLSHKYWNLPSLKAIVAINVSSKVTNMNSMFFGCESLVDISNLASWDISGVKDMEEMFAYCESLTDLSPLSGWDISNVETAEGMFNHCESLDDMLCLKGWSFNKMDGSFKNGEFVLSQNVSGNLTITNDDLIIDGNGFIKFGELKIKGNNITIKNMHFKNSIYAIHNSGKLTLINCKFSENGGRGHHDSGACVYNQGELELINCTFKDNGFSNGNVFPKVYGALYNDSPGKITIKNCEFINNHFAWAGAIYNEGHLEVYGSKFKHNKDYSFSGAIYSNNEVIVEDCEFENNSSVKKCDKGYRYS